MPLAIEIELLTGRYGATRFNDRNRPEWPPHPARLFSAAVALWADAEQRSAAEEDVLRWLERQSAPVIACSDPAHVAVRQGTTHFVPVNDASAVPSIAGTYAAVRDAAATADLAHRPDEQARSPRDVQRARKQAEQARTRVAKDSRRANERTLAAAAIEVFPDERIRQARTFPSITPDDPRVVYLWPDATPDAAQRATLDGLLARIGRLGHSSSFVSCRAADELTPLDEFPPAALVPDEHGSTVVRVPGDGQFDLLEEEFARHQGTEPRALPAVMQRYSAVGVPHELPPPGSVFSPQFVVLGVYTETPVSLLASLPLARALRAALVERPGGAIEMLSGLHVDPDTGKAQPSDRAHAAIVPLAFVGQRHADGAVRGVALVLPGERDDERHAVLQIVASWLAARDGGKLAVCGRDVILRRPDDLASLATLSPKRWCEPQATWATVTPIALDRWPGNLRDGDAAGRATAFERAEQIVARACVHIGLPEPRYVVVRPDAFVVGVPPAHRFAEFRTPNGGPCRPLVHACVTFDAPVAGPVLLGAGRYLGQGLCLPLTDAELRRAGSWDDDD